MLGQHSISTTCRFCALICKCKSIVSVYVNGTQYMCIDFDGHHSGGSSFVYVNDFLLLQKFFVYPQVQVQL